MTAEPAGMSIAKMPSHFPLTCLRQNLLSDSPAQGTVRDKRRAPLPPTELRTGPAISFNAAHSGIQGPVQVVSPDRGSTQPRRPDRMTG
jgi:hypothetical protein